MRTTNIGGPNRDYVVLTDAEDGKRDTHWSDLWHYATVRMVAAARAHGLRPIDGPFGDYSDEAGFIAQANRLGRSGLRRQMGDPPSRSRSPTRSSPRPTGGRTRRRSWRRWKRRRKEQGRRRARREADRHRVDPSGGAAGRQGRHGRQGLRGGALSEVAAAWTWSRRLHRAAATGNTSGNICACFVRGLRRIGRTLRDASVRPGQCRRS